MEEGGGGMRVKMTLDLSRVHGLSQAGVLCFLWYCQEKRKARAFSR